MVAVLRPSRGREDLARLHGRPIENRLHLPLRVQVKQVSPVKAKIKCTYVEVL